jgi:hypothetical protein
MCTENIQYVSCEKGAILKRGLINVGQGAISFLFHLAHSNGKLYVFHVNENLLVISSYGKTLEESEAILK